MYHISKKGLPAICKAQPGNCPLGGYGQHYRTTEEAQAKLDNINAAFNYNGDLLASLPGGQSKIAVIESYINKGNAAVEYYIFDGKFRLHYEIYGRRVSPEEMSKASDYDLMILSAFVNRINRTRHRQINKIINGESGYLTNIKKRAQEDYNGDLHTYIKYLRVLDDFTGDYRTDGLAHNYEQTLFRSYADLDSIRLAGDIVDKTDQTQCSEHAVATAVMMLKDKGWTEQQIKNVATQEKLPVIAAREYGVALRFNRDRQIYSNTSLVAIYARAKGVKIKLANTKEFRESLQSALGVEITEPF